jgi:hypothetical protein
MLVLVMLVRLFVSRVFLFFVVALLACNLLVTLFIPWFSPSNLEILYLRTETDPVSETLFCPFLDKIGTMDIVQNLSFNYTSPPFVPYRAYLKEGL